MNKFIPAVLILFFMAFPALGQEPDTVGMDQVLDSIYRFGDEDILYADSLYADSLVQEFDYSHSPQKATLHSLVLPGLGQAYNEKYYKIPIVWAAMGGVGYAIVYNTNQYKQATLNFILEESDTNERWLKLWRRNMELSYIAATARIYIFN